MNSSEVREEGGEDGETFSSLNSEGLFFSQGEVLLLLETRKISQEKRAEGRKTHLNLASVSLTHSHILKPQKFSSSLFLPRLSQSFPQVLEGCSLSVFTLKFTHKFFTWLPIPYFRQVAHAT